MLTAPASCSASAGLICEVIVLKSKPLTLKCPSTWILPLLLRSATSPRIKPIKVNSSEMPPAQIGAQKNPPLCSQNSRLSSSFSLWVVCGGVAALTGARSAASKVAFMRRFLSWWRRTDRPSPGCGSRQVRAGVPGRHRRTTSPSCQTADCVHQSAAMHVRLPVCRH